MLNDSWAGRNPTKGCSADWRRRSSSSYLYVGCRAFTVVCLMTHTAFLGCKMLQVFCTIYGTAVVFPVMIVLSFYISTSQSLCTVPSMAVFCSSLMLCFLVVLLRCFLNDYEMVPFALIITSGYTFHMWSISVVRYLYFKIFFNLFLHHISVSSDCSDY
jgi:hypothetical protein